MKENKESKYISLASVVSAVSVVFLHTNGCFWKFSTEGYWRTANIIESLFYYAVPVFFMISGATLVDYSERYDLKHYFKRRIYKAGIPFLIWSVIGLIFKLLFGAAEPSGISLGYVIKGILSADFVSVYWFFIPLCCVYLSIPLFSEVPKDRRKHIFTYVAVLSFVINNLIPFALAHFEIEYEFPITISVGSGYLLYVVVGYLLHTNQLSQKERYILYVVAAVGFGIHSIGTYYASIQAGEVVRTYKGYDNVPGILYAVGIFVLMKEIGERIRRESILDKIISFLKNYTFSIYLTHWFIMTALEKFFEINTQSIIYRLGAPFLIIGISIFGTYMVRKLPLGKMVLP